MGCSAGSLSGGQPHRVPQRSRTRITLNEIYEFVRANWDNEDSEGEQDEMDNGLVIDLSQKWGKILAKRIADHHILPDLQTLKINFMDEDNDDIRVLLSECIKNPITELYINGDVLPKHSQSKLFIGFYLDSIAEACRYVTDKLHLWYCLINTKTMIRILTECTNVQYISFFKSKIDCRPPINIPALSSSSKIPTCNIKCLNFFGCGDDEGITLIREDDISCICQIISKTVICFSIKELIINSCDLNKAEVRAILKENKLDEVKVWD